VQGDDDGDTCLRPAKPFALHLNVVLPSGSEGVRSPADAFQTRLTGSSADAAAIKQKADNGAGENYVQIQLQTRTLSKFVTLAVSMQNAD
jgi:hypothetical protein